MDKLIEKILPAILLSVISGLAYTYVDHERLRVEVRNIYDKGVSITERFDRLEDKIDNLFNSRREK